MKNILLILATFIFSPCAFSAPWPAGQTKAKCELHSYRSGKTFQTIEEVTKVLDLKNADERFAVGDFRVWLLASEGERNGNIDMLSSFVIRIYADEEDGSNGKPLFYNIYSKTIPVAMDDQYGFNGGFTGQMSIQHSKIANAHLSLNCKMIK